MRTFVLSLEYHANCQHACNKRKFFYENTFNKRLSQQNKNEIVRTWTVILTVEINCIRYIWNTFKCRGVVGQLDTNNEKEEKYPKYPKCMRPGNWEQ